MLAALLLLPTLAGLACFALPRRRALLLLVAVAPVHLLLALLLPVAIPRPEQWLAGDAPGKLFLVIASLLFTAAACYTIAYLRRVEDEQEEPAPLFIGCLLLFLAAMTLATLSQHLGLFWVAIEATTLASAPLIYFHRSARSLEATWKYLLICSVGIALALLGVFFLAVAFGGEATLTPTALQLATAQPEWLKAAFILFLIGFGTKAGLAPLHNWLPDAHSEAPAGVSALLSGALLNCALLGILRVHDLCGSAGLGAFSGDLLVLLGLLSLAVAAVFLVRQAEYKRLLAYSSVEHIGLIALGTGATGTPGGAALLHAVNHSCTKGALFFLAGNILYVMRTRRTDQVSGLLRALPVSGILWCAGFLSLIGVPPFGTFFTKLGILIALFRYSPVAGGIALLLLAVIGIAMADIFLRMCFGRPQTATVTAGEPRTSVWPALMLLGIVLLMGLLPPDTLPRLLGLPLTWGIF